MLALTKKIILMKGLAAAQALSVTASTAVSSAGRIQEPPRMMMLEKLNKNDDIKTFEDLLKRKADKRPKIGEIEAEWKRLRKSDLELKEMTEFELKIKEFEKKRKEKIQTDIKARKPSKSESGLDKLQDVHVETPVSTVTGSVSSHASAISIKTNSKPVAFPFNAVDLINMPGVPKAPGLAPNLEESELEKKFKEWQRKERSEGLVPNPKVQKIDLPSMNLPDRESVAVHHPEIVSDSEPIVKSVPTLKFSKTNFLMRPESVGGWLQPRLLRPVVTANSTIKPSYTVTKSITEESVAPLSSAKAVVTPIVYADDVSDDTASGCWYYRRPEVQSRSTVYANLPKSKTITSTETDAPLPLKSKTIKDESYTGVYSDHEHPRCPESSVTGCMPFMHNWWKKIGNFFHSKYQKAGAYIRKQKQRWSDYRSNKKHEASEVSYMPNDINKVTAYPGPVSENLKFDDAKSDFSTVSTYAPQSGRSEASFDSTPNTDHGDKVDSEKSFLVLDELPYKPTSIRTLGPISTKIQSELILPSALKVSQKIKTPSVDDLILNQTLPIQSQKTILPIQEQKTILPPKYSLIVPEFVNQLNISNKKLQAFRELKKNMKSELDYLSFKKRKIDNLSSSATNKYVNRMVQFVRIGRETSRAQNDYKILEKLIEDELNLKQKNIEAFRKNVSGHEYNKIQVDSNDFDKIMYDSDHEDTFKSRLENEDDLIYDWAAYGLSRGHVILDHGKKDSLLSTVEKLKEQDSKPDHTVSIKSESDPKKEESDTKVTKSWNDFKVNADIAIESFTNNEINRWKKLMSPSDLDGVNEIKLLLNINKNKKSKIIKDNFFTDLKVESNIESRWNSFKESWKAQLELLEFNGSSSQENENIWTNFLTENTNSLALRFWVEGLLGEIGYKNLKSNDTTEINNDWGILVDKARDAGYIQHDMARAKKCKILKKIIQEDQKNWDEFIRSEQLRFNRSE